MITETGQLFTLLAGKPEPLRVYPFDSKRISGMDDSEMNGDDPVVMMIADLRKYIVFDDHDTQLTPLSANFNGKIEVAIRFAQALQNEKLFEGYLPSTQRTVSGTLSILDKWVADPTKLAYIYSGAEGHHDYDSYLTFQFSMRDKVRKETEAWVTYGLWHPEKAGMGLTKNALSLAINYLSRETYYYGLPVSKFVTSVSENNPESINILLSNGFEVDSTRAQDQSFIGPDGESIPMVRYIAQERVVHKNW